MQEPRLADNQVTTALRTPAVVTRCRLRQSETQLRPVRGEQVGVD
jgi:hypothetical protein